MALEDEPGQIEARKGEQVEKVFIARWLTPGKYEVTGVDAPGGHVLATVVPLKPYES